MSKHEVRVIRIERIEKHPNADRLSLIRIGDNTVVFETGSFGEGDLAVHVEPDYEVPCSPVFAWLFAEGSLPTARQRVKARRLRGVWSYGLLVPAPPGASEGDCVMEELGITRWDDTADACARDGYERSLPDSLLGAPRYDLESWHKHKHLLFEGERVIVTEKIHGTNARYAYHSGRMWCGSRTQWKTQSPGNWWWRCLEQNPWIEEILKNSPAGTILYGEVYGDVQDLKYGTGKGELRFSVFDHWIGHGWMDSCSFITKLSDVLTPVVYDGPYYPELMKHLAEQDSRAAWPHKQLQEGVVIKPAYERQHESVGRVALKLVSNRYLAR